MSLSYILFREIRRQKTLRSGQFYLLNDSASLKMIMKVYFNFLFKVLELFDCRWDDLQSYIWLLIGTSFASLTSKNRPLTLTCPAADLARAWLNVTKTLVIISTSSYLGRKFWCIIIISTSSYIGRKFWCIIIISTSSYIGRKFWWYRRIMENYPNYAINSDTIGNFGPVNSDNTNDRKFWSYYLNYTLILIIGS